MSAHLSKKKRFIFKLAAIGMVLLFFVLIEVLLRIVGYGSDYPLFVQIENHPDQLVMNPHVGEKYFFFTHNATSGYAEPFSKAKPADTYRIFVLGASTGVGYPYRHNGSFHRALQFALNETFPQKNIEIINLSLTAINSYTIKDFTQQIIDQNPDAVLIYAGHNEYYGALGVGASNGLSDNPTFVNFVLALREYRIVQSVAQLFAKAKQSLSSPSENRESLMQKMVADQYIKLDSDKFWVGVNQFDVNMEATLEMLDKAKIQTFISNLVSNERGLPPFVSDTTNQENNAKRHFDMGEKALSTGDYNEAKERFIKAKEFDMLRFRAPEAMNQLLQEKSNRFKNVHLVDTKKAFENESPHRIIGNELLLEHVHPNLDGYALLAHAFYISLKNNNAITENWPQTLTYTQLKTQIPITEVDSIAGALEVAMLKEGWPFYEKIDPAALRNTSLAQQLGGRLAIKSITWEVAMQQLYTWYINENQPKKALKVLQGQLLDDPTQNGLLLKMADVCIAMDSIGRAKRYFDQYIDQTPDPKMDRAFAKKLIKAGALGHALSYLEKGMKANPNDLQMLREYAAAQAIVQLQKTDAPTVDQLLKLAENYLALRQRTMTENIVDQVLSKEPKNVRALELHAKAKKL